MEKNYWYEALKSGTIIGIVDCAFSLLKLSFVQAEKDLLSDVVYYIGLVVFIALLYSFTKRMSDSAKAETGFPYGKCMGFVFAMMIFAGVVMGTYSAIMNNFVITDMVNEQIDTAFVSLQDIFSTDQFDTLYDTYRKAMFNPFMLIASSIIGYWFIGGIFGLMTSSFAKRNPDIFANDNTPHTDE